ncbi:MAG TPA: Sec-independent protein translocase subunit TatA [Marmoricola sp.]
MFRDIGPAEIILILAVLVLLFGAKKLPELARGSGRALRIFKAETKGLIDDDDDEPAATTDTTAARQIEASGDKAPTGSVDAERSRDTTD